MHRHSRQRRLSREAMRISRPQRPQGTPGRHRRRRLLHRRRPQRHGAHLRQLPLRRSIRRRRIEVSRNVLPEALSGAVD